ncbi:sodium-dependent transporter [Streptomyces sp. 7-21]|uniref:sodium-dependent transporter n=1 Tax=Streptomyces sp. 7-21 TaxID=2802283 RepID=UPI00191E2E33|nr:sodium-dependent transporter [Streptomyces sp. 7-21]MBL1067762.1 sodium-dependent transporter [Streptomyces sp. 7-21]
MANQPPRELWGTRLGFLMAAIGSAVGLGNIWRFPAVTYENGGGAFIVPYLAALLTAGIPLLILEYTLGRRYRSSPPGATRLVARPAEAIGWWQVVICFVIAAYYTAILAWSVRYVGFSLNQAWEDNPDGSEAFFYNDFLKIAETPGDLSTFVSGIFWPMLVIWLVTIVILALGVRRGIATANKIGIPLLVIFFLILVVRALTLDGALDGLDALFSPDWGALGEGSVWVAAYGQIFFSLSVGFGIMITYASYLHRRSDLSGSALVAGFANSSFEILAGIAVFAALGFLAAEAGTGVGDVVAGGPGLSFVMFPQIISEMPMGALFGVLFFASLVLAGFTSLLSIVQVVVSAVEDRVGLSRQAAVFAVTVPLAVISIALFSTGSGLYVLDVADHFINQYGIVLAGLALVITVSWVARKLPLLQRDADATSAIALGVWWRICLSVVTPLVLGWMMVDSLSAELDENYGGYDTSFLLYSGWAVAGGALLLGVLLSLLKWRSTPHSPDTERPDAAGPRITKNEGGR